MARVYADNVAEITQTYGTATFELDGTVTGFIPFEDVLATGDTCIYLCEHAGQWERGVGTYDEVANTLTRDTVIQSSDPVGGLVSFPPGTKLVKIAASLKRMAFKSGNFTSGRIPFANSLGELTDSNILTFNSVTGEFVASADTHTWVSTPRATFVQSTTSTGNAIDVLIIGCNSTGTPGAGFGAAVLFTAESSTTADQLCTEIESYWATATHGSRCGRFVVSAYDASGVRECARFESSGSAAMVGFLGATAVARQSSTTDLKNVLVNFGFLTDGGATPLVTDDGAITCGDLTATTASITETDAVTNATTTTLMLNHQSSGTPAAGFGMDVLYRLESSTTDRLSAQDTISWVVATDASRTTRWQMYVYDTAARECIRMEASGSAPMLGFYGTAAVAQGSSTGETVGFTGGAGTAVRADSTFTGNVGATAYRISDIVKHLKNIGIIAQ